MERPQTTSRTEDDSPPQATYVERPEPAHLAADELVGISEIHGLLLHVTKEFVEELTCCRDFPEPAAELIGGAIWLRTEVEAWLNGHGDALTNLFKAPWPGPA